MRASHIKTFRGHGSFISSNLVGETHVPRNAPGTPQANARFRPPGTHARSADESEESGGACAERAGSGGSRTGSVREHRAPEGDTEGDSSVGLGRSKGLGRAGRARGKNVRSPDKETHRWPPDGQAAHPGLCRLRGRRAPDPPATNDAIRPAPPPSQKCRGRSAGTPILHGVRITRELRRARN
jgi:hypothetical protein